MVMEVTLLPSPLMQRRRTMVAREIKTMVERGPKEGREDVTLVTSLVTMQESALIEGTFPGMMTTTTREGMAGTTGSKEKGRLPLIVMEMGNLSRGQEIPGTMSLMLLIKEKSFYFCICPLCFISTQHYGCLVD